jgi:glucose/arabinose dehydrogenase
MRRIPWRAVGLLASAGLLAACGSGAAAAPTWVPQPSVSLEGGGPEQTQPNRPGPPSGPTGAPPIPNPTSPNSSTGPNGGGSGSGVVAKDLSAPTGLVILPDGSALVGERTTGRIVRVQPIPNQPVPTLRTLSGLSTTGDGGLLDLALSPTYDEDGLIYAYVTTPTDNRVIDFTLTGPTADVLTGIPRGVTGNTGRLVFDAAGNLYVGTGDAGSPQLAANPNSLAGKVLRVDGIGHPVPGNPKPGSAVFTRGHHMVNGLCTSPTLDSVYETEAPSEVNVLNAGADYGWPAPGPRAQRPASTLPSDRSGAGGCAVEGNTIFVATSDGQALLAASLGPRGQVDKFTLLRLDKPYGRLRTVVAAPDGALWITTTNKDGHGHPLPDDERVVRIIQAGAAGGEPPV